MAEHRIAIVGAGFSGTLTAVQLLRQAIRPIELVLIDSADVAARGVAYGTTCPQHLLNVPAGRMSAIPDEPLHFLDWASNRDSAIGPLDFVPRLLYGEYLAELLAAAVRSARPGARLSVMHDRVTRIEASKDINLKLASGVSLVARQCVLALGNFAPVRLPVVERDLGAYSRYVRDPWAGNGPPVNNQDDAVLLIGTGLTAVDMILQLEASGHRGPLVAVSRHGLLPAVHADVGASGIDIGLRSGMGVRHAVRRVRDACSTHPWRQVVDGLRAGTPRIWGDWSESDRRRFLRHVRTYWDIHRHRIAPSVGATVARLVGDGRLELVAGTLIAALPTAGCVEVKVRVRGDRGVRSIQSGLVVNCTGPDCDYGRLEDPLVRSLLDSGLAKCDALHLGLETADSGALLGQDGSPSSRLFTLGPPCKPRSWETTAVPEIRAQAASLAKRLLADAPN